MVARDVMQTDFPRLRPTNTLREAAAMMVSSGESSLPVLDDEGAPIGVISEHAILQAAMPDYLLQMDDLSFLPHGYSFPPPDGADLGSVTVGQSLAGTPLRTVTPDDPLVEVARVVLACGVSRCLVVDQGKLVGIVRRSDLLDVLARGGSTTP